MFTALPKTLNLNTPSLVINTFTSFSLTSPKRKASFSNMTNFLYENALLTETNISIIITRLAWIMYKHKQYKINKKIIHIVQAHDEPNLAERIEATLFHSPLHLLAPEFIYNRPSTVFHVRTWLILCRVHSFGRVLVWGEWNFATSGLICSAQWSAMIGRVLSFSFKQS